MFGHVLKYPSSPGDLSHLDLPGCSCSQRLQESLSMGLLLPAFTNCCCMKYVTHIYIQRRPTGAKGVSGDHLKPKLKLKLISPCPHLFSVRSTQWQSFGQAVTKKIYIVFINISIIRLFTYIVHILFINLITFNWCKQSYDCLFAVISWNQLKIYKMFHNSTILKVKKYML